MAIKTEAIREHFSYFSDQEELARRFDEAFDITYAKRLGEYAFWLAEPKQRVRDRFGLRRELPILYCPQQRVDARLLTALDKVTESHDFKHRLERGLAIVVHKSTDDDVLDLVQGRSDRIIIPVTASQLLDPRRGDLFLRSRLAAALGGTDLFGMASPITNDKYFFGRDDLVQTLVDRTIVRHESSGVFGLRKTGKTSVLFALRRRLEGKPALVEYIECSNPGIHGARWWQLLQELVERAQTSAGLDGVTELKDRYRPETAGTRFAAALKSLLTRRNLERIVFLLDEIEFVSSGLANRIGRHWDDDFLPFWQTIRATHQETDGRLCFLVAGVNPSCVERPHFAGVPNPIFQLATPHYLEPLSKESTRKMLRAIGKYGGLGFGEDVYPYLQTTYGGHPYLIRLACSEVWKASDTRNPEKMSNITVDDFWRSRERIRTRLAQPIRDILLSLVWWYPDEYDLLRILATGDRQFITDYVAEKPESVTQFVRYGLLKDNSREFAIEDLRDFLAEQGEAYKREVSPFTRGDMPPELLPQVPDRELLGKLFEMRTDIELRLRKTIVLYLGVKTNWNAEQTATLLARGLGSRPDRKNPAALFVGRSPQEVMSDLFTLDLRDIVLKHWDVFSPVFDQSKQRFEMNMDTLNKARRVDAHSKPISDEEATEIKNSYGWLLARLSKVPV